MKTPAFTIEPPEFGRTGLHSAAKMLTPQAGDMLLFDAGPLDAPEYVATGSLLARSHLGCVYVTTTTRRPGE